MYGSPFHHQNLSMTLLFSLFCMAGAFTVVPIPSGAGHGVFPFPHSELPDIDFSVFPDWEPVDTDSHFTHYTPPSIGISEIPDYRVPDVGISFSDYQFPEIDISYYRYIPPAVSISYFDFQYPAIGISEIPHRT
jgi:hypothetical protein